MSFDRLRSSASALAQMAARGFAPPKLGLVSSFDGRPGGYAVKVRLQPEDIETGWLPIVTLLAGQSWGIYAGPSVGDQAVVLFQEGDATSGICVGFLPSADDPPPAVESGEIHLVAKDAEASILLRPDGSIASKGTWVHDGSFLASGNITTEEELTDHSGVTVSELRDSYNNHAHTGVQTGGGVTGPTNDPAA